MSERPLILQYLCCIHLNMKKLRKAFAKVVDMDPDCAMAYWGLAMCKIGHPKFYANSGRPLSRDLKFWK